MYSGGLDLLMRTWRGHSCVATPSEVISPVLHIGVSACVWVYVCKCICRCMGECGRTCVCVCLWVCVSVWVYACACADVCVCECLRASALVTQLPDTFPLLLYCMLLSLVLTAFFT